jgi:hypothetical protein
MRRFFPPRCLQLRQRDHDAQQTVYRLVVLFQPAGVTVPLALDEAVRLDSSLARLSFKNRQAMLTPWQPAGVDRVGREFISVDGLGEVSCYRPGRRPYASFYGSF